MLQNANVFKWCIPAAYILCLSVLIGHLLSFFTALYYSGGSPGARVLGAFLVVFLLAAVFIVSAVFIYLLRKFYLPGEKPLPVIQLLRRTAMGAAAAVIFIGIIGVLGGAVSIMAFGIFEAALPPAEIQFGIRLAAAAFSVLLAPVFLSIATGLALGTRRLGAARGAWLRICKGTYLKLLFVCFAAAGLFALIRLLAVSPDTGFWIDAFRTVLVSAVGGAGLFLSFNICGQGRPREEETAGSSGNKRTKTA